MKMAGNNPPNSKAYYRYVCNQPKCLYVQPPGINTNHQSSHSIKSKTSQKAAPPSLLHISTRQAIIKPRIKHHPSIQILPLPAPMLYKH